MPTSGKIIRLFQSEGLIRHHVEFFVSGVFLRSVPEPVRALQDGSAGRGARNQNIQEDLQGTGAFSTYVLTESLARRQMYCHDRPCV